MFDYYKNNSNYVLSIKPKDYFNIIIAILIILLWFLSFGFIYKVSDKIDTRLKVTCEDNICDYYIYSTLDNVKIIKNSSKIIIDKKQYFYSVEEISDMQYDSYANLNYQLLKIDLELVSKYQQNNLYLDAKIKLKEERLIKKIKKIIF